MVSITNIIDLLLSGTAFTALYIIFPGIFIGRFFKGRAFIEKVFASLCCGTLIMTIFIYILGFIGWINIFGLLGLILIVTVGYTALFRRKEVREWFGKVLFHTHLLSSGVYTMHRVVNTYILGGIKRRLYRLWKRFSRRPVFIMVLSALFIYAMWYRSYHSITQTQYGISDLYTHTLWIKELLGGNMFYAGVYPYGMHAVIAGLKLIFPFDVVLLMRFLGPWFGLLIFMSMYLLLTRVMKSSAAILGALLFYCISGMIGINDIARQCFALPQEFGMIFLYPTAYFLIGYFKEKKNLDLIMFAVALCMTMMSHFFITIVAAILCFSIGIIYIVRIFKDKMIFPLIIAVFGGIAAGVLPMLFGRVMGHNWEPSFMWVSSSREAVAQERPTLEYILQDLLSANNIYWYYVFACMIILAIFCVIMILRKKHEFFPLAGFFLYFTLLIILGLGVAFGLPSIMPIGRLRIFFIYSLSFITVTPISVLCAIEFKKKHHRQIMSAACGTAVLAYAIILFSTGTALTLAFSVQTEYSQAVHSYYRIINEFKNNTWTIVSTTDEYSLVLGKGYLYEIKRLMVEMEDFDPAQEIFIPTENVFVFVEKQPLRVEKALWYGKPLYENEPETRISEQFAAQSFSIAANSYESYRNYTERCIVESKAFYWAEAYKKAFPLEVSIYYDDDFFTVYHLKQNVNILNNLNIDYYFNSTGAAGEQLTPQEDTSQTDTSQADTSQTDTSQTDTSQADTSQADTPQ